MSNGTTTLVRTAMAELDNLHFGAIEVIGRNELTERETETVAIEGFRVKDIVKTVSDAATKRVEAIKGLVYRMADAEVGEDVNYTLYAPEAVVTEVAPELVDSLENAKDMLVNAVLGGTPADGLVGLADAVRRAQKAVEEGTTVKVKGLKMCREIREYGGGVDSNTLLMALYEGYGEEVGDKTGKAWAEFKEITDAVEVPRQLNEGKLTARLAQAVSPMTKKDMSVFKKAVEAATTLPKKNPSFYIRKMTKDEQKAYEAGEL